MRELNVGAEIFEAPESRILDYRFEETRGWFGKSLAACVIVTADGEFRGEGRTGDDAAEAALEAWERHFARDGDAEAGSSDEDDDSGYMSSQSFSTRKGAHAA